MRVLKCLNTLKSHHSFNYMLCRDLTIWITIFWPMKIFWKKKHSSKHFSPWDWAMTLYTCKCLTGYFTSKGWKSWLFKQKVMSAVTLIPCAGTTWFPLWKWRIWFTPCGSGGPTCEAHAMTVQSISVKSYQLKSPLPKTLPPHPLKHLLLTQHAYSF